jgi:hypothetical protein
MPGNLIESPRGIRRRPFVLPLQTPKDTTYGQNGLQLCQNPSANSIPEIPKSFLFLEAHSLSQPSPAVS